MRSNKHDRAHLLQVCCLCVLALCSPRDAGAQEPAIPVDIHMSLLVKVLAYDRSLQNHNNDPIVLGIVHQCTWKVSQDVAREVRNVVKAYAMKIAKRPIRVVPVVFTSVADFESVLNRQPIAVLYFAPLQGSLLEDLLSISRARQIHTITGVAEYVEAGVAVGIGEREDRPLILVNLPAARLEGADLSAQVLQFAKVIP
jgi:hypothetical protein